MHTAIHCRSNVVSGYKKYCFLITTQDPIKNLTAALINNFSVVLLSHAYCCYLCYKLQYYNTSQVVLVDSLFTTVVLFL